MRATGVMRETVQEQATEAFGSPQQPVQSKCQSYFQLAYCYLECCAVQLLRQPAGVFSIATCTDV